MNTLLAWVLFVSVFMVGIPTAVDEVEAGPGAQLVIEAVLPESPATGVLPMGARIDEITAGDVTITAPRLSEFQALVAAVGTGTVSIAYTMGDSSAEVTVAPASAVLPDNPEQLALGVQLMMVENRRYGVGEALVEGTKLTGRQITTIATGVVGLIGQSVVGQADLSQVAGPVGIVGLVGDAAAMGFTTLLSFTAMLSLSLAVINLLPFPVLDGGRLLFVAIESITGRTLDPIWMSRLNLVGIVLLLTLMVVVTFNDVWRLIA
jgi:regulator of sigma E protease